MTIAQALTELLDPPTELTAKQLPPLKIALLGYRSAPHVGGQGIYLKYLSSALAELGHEVHVYSGPPYPDLPQNVSLIKVPSLDLYACDNHITALRLRHLKSFTDTWEWWSMLTGGFAEPYTFGRRICRLLQHQQYDIVHDNQSLCYGLLKLQNHGAKVVATIHHPVHRDREIAIAAQRDWGMRLLVRRWYSFINMQEKVVRNLQHLVTVSHTSQRDINNHFKLGQPAQVIPNGIDTTLFKPLANVKKSPCRLITTASSDQPLKGLKYLILALKEVSQTIPQIELRIIGQLGEQSENQQLINRLNLGKNVSFTTGISSEQLVMEYNQARIAVCPSLYEGFGLPAGEAMACELPVVSTDGGALPEVIGDAGMVVPQANATALAQAIIHLLHHPEQAQALGERARERIVANFCWHRVAQQLTNYYREILAQRC